MAFNEDRARFAMWSMWAALLVVGIDLRKMSKETIEVLINKKAIAVNQEPPWNAGLQYSEIDGMEICFKPLKGGDCAVTF